MGADDFVSFEDLTSAPSAEVVVEEPQMLSVEETVARWAAALEVRRPELREQRARARAASEGPA